jgi:hypothetical protein
VRHLLHDTEHALPDWRDGLLGFVGEGLRAMVVIFGHLAPIYAAVAWTVVARCFVPTPVTVWLTIGFVAFPLFAPLSLPIACLLLAHGGWLAIGEAALASGAFTAVVFMIPAGFLQVSRTGRHRDAFAIWRTLPFVAANLRAYGRAWWHSGLASLTGHFVLPLAPWGVVWCYLAILFLFNELLVPAHATTGWLARARALHEPRPRRSIGVRRIRDAAGEPVTVVDLPWCSAPLPRSPWRRAPGA